MSSLTATSKGAANREAILDRAYDIARFAGIEGLSIGPLAHAVSMYKSGVFAHFGTREDQPLTVLEFAATRSGELMLVAAHGPPRRFPPPTAALRNRVAR